MLSNRFAFIALAVACVAAAAAGGYLATRQNTKPVTTVTAVASPEAPAHVGKPVQETEAVIGDARNAQASPAQTAAAAEAPSAAPLKRDVAPGRAASGRASRTADPAAARRITQQLPSLERSWPSGPAPTPAQTPAPPAVASAPAVETP